MSVQTQATITQKESIAPAWWRLSLSVPDLPSAPLPGQFLLARCADPFRCYLRRPLFPTGADQERIDLLLRPGSDPGLAWLATRRPGDSLDLIGPVGNGFLPEREIRNLLLISDDQRPGPLLGQLQRAVSAGISVTLVLGGSRAAAIYPVKELPPVVEVQVATLDGSLGYRGPVSDLLPDLLLWADAAWAVGTTGAGLHSSSVATPDSWFILRFSNSE